MVSIGLVSGPAEAQQLRIDAWTADDGLPASAVNAVLQTRDGFLWLATFAGLVRYDGARFEVFNTGTTPQLRSSRFTTLFEDREGSLWAATEEQGVVRYRDRTFTAYTTAEGVPDNAEDFFYDPEGRLLLDSLNGIAEWTGERFTSHSGPTPTKHNRSFMNVFRMPSGATWYLDKTGYHKVEQGRVSRSVPVHEGRWMFEDRRGRIWIEFEERGARFLLVIDAGKVRRFSSADGVPAFGTMKVFEDRDGTLWFGLRGNGGLLRFKDGAFTRYTTADGLPHNNVSRAFQDREGTVWVPTEGGLARLTNRVVTAYAPADGLASDNTYPVYQDRQGTIWIGGWPGLTQYKDGVFRAVGDPGVSRELVTALFEDRDGVLWIGMWGGLARLRNGVVDNFDAKLAGVVVRAIAQDTTGDVWIGGGNVGLYRYSRGALHHFTPDDGPAGRTVLSILPRANGGLWIGTDAGLTEYRDGVFTNYGAKDGLTGNNVRSLYEDRYGVLWAGTYDTGLFRFANGRFTRFTTRDGLFDNGAFQILEDARGNFWISGNSGIYRVARADLEQVAAGKARTVTAIPYGRRDGMNTAECNGGTQPAGIRAADGRLWFPTQKGVAVIDADHLPINTLPPPVVLTGLTIDREPVPVPAAIEIRPDQVAFEINYAGLTYVQPELTRFRYKLEGLDADWVEAGNRRTAYFSHVPYGTYRFIVTAANRDGVWNETGAAIPVMVIPPFWSTRWFQVSMLLVLVIALAAAYRRRILILEREQAVHEAFARQLIDSQETERKRIAAELHDSVGQTLIVINNSALAGINAAATGDDEARNRWSTISTTAAAAINEVREIAYNLAPYQLDRLGLAETILDMLDRVSSASGITFTTDIGDVDGRLPKESETSVFRLVQESVNNIVKHSGATTAEVGLSIVADRLLIEVRDHGRGFDGAEAPLSGAGRHGFGLNGLHERARMLGGTCVIESAPGAGTRVAIQIPVARAA